MMKAVSDIASTYDVKLSVFMEKRMACGIGVCLSCVCETNGGSNGYSRVCKEGPVFEAKEIVWS
jgi:dihydroorotate dehydrogenase electron transfer subunit